MCCKSKTKYNHQNNIGPITCSKMDVIEAIDLLLQAAFKGLTEQLIQSTPFSGVINKVKDQ